MTILDLFVISLYFILVLGLGFRFRRKASKDLESYFLAGKKLHWLALAMSGSVSNFDITGTMWIVSILFVLGMKSMWHHWMWGFLMGAFFLAYMGKWVRRSNVLTAAEWMKTRFGEEAAGQTARTVYALMAVVTQASFLGYAFQGIGKFAAVYIPLESLGPIFAQYEPQILAFSIIGLTTLYVLLGGLYSVVFTDVMQTVILTLSSLIIAGIAWMHMTPQALSRIPDGFTSLSIPWRISEFAGTDNSGFEFFGALVIVWVLKGLLLNAGGPGQMYDFQRFLAARNDRDAAKIGAAWSGFLVVRWAMVMGITLLAITGSMGIRDSEQVMPVVLRDFLPLGLRGLVIAGLLAAFMSTFSSTVNSGAAFIVRDIWQPLTRKQTTEKQAVRFSYLATILLVVLGLGIGVQGKSIADIWNWMMMALGAGIIIPNVLRWYWWRMNGWGYALGTMGGILFSLLALLFKSAPDYLVFPVVVLASLIMCIGGSILTPPVKREILESFYDTVRPFGFWGHIRRDIKASESVPNTTLENPTRIILNVILGMMAIVSLYMFPMYLVGHWYVQALIWGGCGLGAIVVLRFTWYNHLPNP